MTKIEAMKKFDKNLSFVLKAIKWALSVISLYYMI
ncbi:hypothetical protein HDEF_2172 [Candidatus Hamiltonella defensa 5AT (Acyrthosiphon pisum)]|uniref:Uncharacterized protein n=1 Tax=Hamiltonella defensa subsp. Acyrthosiphon pisum (strain 5AT) TaxID=572265 RepID=C4K873_HAMD5|nr:hypothetical protein HDEF_2172 [Candidatus Hamiltonella defensa 5AT (Acyrthosiphon pisum)]